MKRQFYIGIAASILCLSQLSNIDTAQAQLNCQDVADGCLKINTEALQMLVNVSEIESQNTVQKVGEGSLPTLQPLTGSSFTPPNKQITREIEHLWQMEVAEDTENNFTANYGCSNFTNPGQNSPSIQLVSIQSTIKPIGQSSSNSGKFVIQGGATFTFDLSNTKASGNHSCSLQINVIENNPT